MATKADKPAKEPKYFGLLPLVSYNYVLPTPDGGIPPNAVSTYVWPALWKPGYGLFKYKVMLEPDRDPEQWDWAFIECGGMYHSMYDFCGGILTSSALYRVLMPQTSRRFTGWGDAASQRFRSPQVPMPPLVNESGGPWVELPASIKRVHAIGTSSPYSSPTRDWFCTVDCAKLFIDYIPDATPYIGPGITNLDELHAIARNSVFAWLWAMANANARTAVFAADRSRVDPKMRQCLSLGSRAIARRFQGTSSVTFTMDTRADSATAGRGVRTWSNHHGLTLTPVEYRTKARFYPGHAYRNRNSGQDVAMTSCVMPSIDMARVPASTYIPISRDEVAKLHEPNYLRLFPNFPFHNS